MPEGEQADTEADPIRFELSDRQRIAWLRLWRTDNVGPATFRDLINHCGSAENALSMLPTLATRGGRQRHPHIPSEDEAEAELAAIARHGARLIGIGEPDYPPLLRLSDQAPPLVTVKGDAAVLAQPCVAIVGSRNASMAGLTMARRLAAGLGEAGYAVASGLARGIDAAAHEAALETGTIAVLAGGPDRPYPPENVPLLERIETGGPGCSITEKPFGWQPRSKDFPRRNRIIAGLSIALVVVEAAARSGSLTSARLAGELGRLVLAVPGSPLDPRAHGTNTLIRDGATLVRSVDDIVEAIAPLDPEAGLYQPPPPPIDMPSPGEPPPGDDARERVIALLGPAPVPVDDLIAEAGVGPAQMALIIIELDLAGRIERHSGNRVSLLLGDT
ncbi:MAG: DNA-processing protein DprA [Roseitalea porphyridii]|uniref:DNA-processing protein DprA n=1 Tax=Roseitalea porphyridii TaxID=1852022 RepID=UPI0032D9619C